MKQRDIAFHNGRWLQWGDFLTDGRSVIGLYPSTWPETTRKPHAKPLRARRREPDEDKPLIPLPTPHSTRNRPSARPLLHKLDTTSEKLDRVVVIQPDEIKLVTVMLWHKRYPFQLISNLLNMTSRQIGEIKYYMLGESEKIG